MISHEPKNLCMHVSISEQYVQLVVCFLSLYISHNLLCTITQKLIKSGMRNKIPKIKISFGFNKNKCLKKLFECIIFYESYRLSTDK